MFCLVNVLKIDDCVVYVPVYHRTYRTYHSKIVKMSTLSLKKCIFEEKESIYLVSTSVSGVFHRLSPVLKIYESHAVFC